MRARKADVERNSQHGTYTGVRTSLVVSSLLGHAAQLRWRGGGGGRT